MNATRKQLNGVFPVFQTPFLENESIDIETLQAEIDWLFSCGADGIVMAMVSEVLRLSDIERRQLAELACRFAKGRGPVVISVGAECAKLAEEYARHAEASGATAVMAIPPISVGLPETELFAYFQRILHATELPVIVQDASGYVGRPMSISFQAGLLETFGPERVLFKPEAAPIGPRLSALRDATDGRGCVFEGTGGIALVDSFRRGIVGTMPGAELIRGIVLLWKSMQAGDDQAAYRLSLPISSIVALQSSLDAFLAIEKYLLVKQGIFRNTIVRGPTGFVLDAETRAEVDRLFALLDETVSSMEDCITPVNSCDR